MSALSFPKSYRAMSKTRQDKALFVVCTTFCVLCLLAAGDWRVWRESESPLLPLDRHRKAPKAIKALADGIFSLLVWWSVISFVSNERGSD
jgi:amino acid transporter